MKLSVKKFIPKSWALPDSISVEEFKTGIREAERGPFYTIEESKKMINKWRERKHSK